MAYNISQSERQRRSERAIKLQKEGKIGRQFGMLGGRPSKSQLQQQTICALLDTFSDSQLHDLALTVKDTLDNPYIDYVAVYNQQRTL